MTDFGVCYNSTGTKCSGRPQPGTIALRDAVLRLYVIFASYGIYNCRPVRGGGALSTHGEGRGWDCRANAFDPEQKKAGDELAALLIKHAHKLGIQRIIWNRRQWDVRTGEWRAYGGQSPHTDHLHIELCWAAAAGPKALTESYVWMVLNEEAEMTPEQEAKLDKLLESVGERYANGPTIQKALVKDDLSQPGLQPLEHLNIIQDLIDTFRGEVAQTLARIEALVSGS